MTGAKNVRIFVAAVIALVAVVAVVGLFVAGSPGARREVRLDEQRANDLMNIASAVDGQYARTGALPTELESLANDSRSAYYIPSLNDPATGEPYAYEVTGDSTYNLCATFEQASVSLKDDAAMRPTPIAPRQAWYDRRWEHPAGRHCFELDARDSLPRQACSLTNPCQAGSTCAVLPGEEGPVCVPQGAECAAAGCPGACVIMESYPVQVRCTGESPKEAVTDDSCVLMQDRNTGAVDCFGCAGRVCKDPSPDHVPYSRDEGAMGIPYSCYAAETGCELAQ